MSISSTTITLTIFLGQVSLDNIKKIYHKKLPISWLKPAAVHRSPSDINISFPNTSKKYIGSNVEPFIICHPVSSHNELTDNYIHISQTIHSSPPAGCAPPNFLDYILIEPTTGREIIIPASEKVKNATVLNKCTILANIKTANHEMNSHNLPEASLVYQQKVYRIDNDECFICMDNPKENYIIVPCGHDGMCSDCVKSVKTCPTCREPVSQFIKHYVK
jgi:hypothetical protein